MRVASESLSQVALPFGWTVGLIFSDSMMHFVFGEHAHAQGGPWAMRRILVRGKPGRGTMPTG